MRLSGRDVRCVRGGREVFSGLDFEAASGEAYRSVDITGKKILVTGADGFIGSHLVEALLTLGQEVVSLDNFATGHRMNLDDVRAAVGAQAWRRHRFVEADIATSLSGAQFDAVVGRLILQFFPDPVAALRSLVVAVRPGGVVVFQESNWASFLAQSVHLPLRSLCGSLIFDAFRRSGATPRLFPSCACRASSVR